MTTLNKILEGCGDLEGAMAVIVIDDKGGVMAFSEDTAVALVFPDERSDEPILEVRCRLDFIYYFSKLLGIPIKFKNMSPTDREDR